MSVWGAIPVCHTLSPCNPVCPFSYLSILPQYPCEISQILTIYTKREMCSALPSLGDNNIYKVCPASYNTGTYEPHCLRWLPLTVIHLGSMRQTEIYTRTVLNCAYAFALTLFLSGTAWNRHRSSGSAGSVALPTGGPAQATSAVGAGADRSYAEMHMRKLLEQHACFWRGTQERSARQRVMWPVSSVSITCIAFYNIMTSEPAVIRILGIILVRLKVCRIWLRKDGTERTNNERGRVNLKAEVTRRGWNSDRTRGRVGGKMWGGLVFFLLPFVPPPCSSSTGTEGPAQVSGPMGPGTDRIQEYSAEHTNIHSWITNWDKPSTKNTEVLHSGLCNNTFYLARPGLKFYCKSVKRLAKEGGTALGAGGVSLSRVGFACCVRISMMAGHAVLHPNQPP